MTIIFTTVGKNPIRNGISLIINKREWNAVLGYNLKNDRMILVLFPKQTIQHHSSPSHCPIHGCQKAEVDQFYEDLQDFLELTPTTPQPGNQKNKKCPIHHRGLECKSRKSRDTWSNRQVWPWRKKWSRAKDNWILPREHTGHSKNPFLTTQETTSHMLITKWSILKSDWLHSS